MKVAVVADVHLHDLFGGYGMLEDGSGDLALRTLADTMASTRVSMKAMRLSRRSG